MSDIGNDLREAMSRANEQVPYGPKEESLRRGTPVKSEGPPTSAPVVQLTRVEVKCAVAGYINSVFQDRTAVDGVILQPSLEVLIETLTEIIFRMRRNEKSPGNSRL